MSFLHLLQNANCLPLWKSCCQRCSKSLAPRWLVPTAQFFLYFWMLQTLAFLRFCRYQADWPSPNKEVFWVLLGAMFFLPIAMYQLFTAWSLLLAISSNCTCSLLVILLYSISQEIFDARLDWSQLWWTVYEQLIVTFSWSISQWLISDKGMVADVPYF